MKLNICDICKKEVDEYGLRTLQDYLKTDSIKHLCPECNDELNTISLRMESAITDIRISWLKKVLAKWKVSGGTK